jgi:hypothetical protein
MPAVVVNKSGHDGWTAGHAPAGGALRVAWLGLQSCHFRWAVRPNFALSDFRLGLEILSEELRSRGSPVCAKRIGRRRVRVGDFPAAGRAEKEQNQPGYG